MSAQETVIQKLFNNPLLHGYLRFAGEVRQRRSARRDFRSWLTGRIWPATYQQERRQEQAQVIDGELNDDVSSSQLSFIANREVHLEGYRSHEEVVRAYLEYSGIDPDSKEGRFYFEL